MTDRRAETTPQRQVAQHLTGVLADSYLLYHTTQLCHWNVAGEQFRPLHEMFEQQYRALAEAIDLIAERIRALGFYTPGTLSDYVTLSDIEQQGRLHAADGMLEQLITCHDIVVERIQRACSAAQRAADDATVDLLIERLRAHQKATWMLKSQAGHESAHLDVRDVPRGATGSPKLAQAGGV